MGIQFHEAMRVIFEDGEKVRRTSWPDGEYIFVAAAMQTIFKNTDKKYVRYTPSRVDMFANDWEIVRE